VVNESDPFPSKGIFLLTPASGVAYVGFPARLGAGDSVVTATAECNRHGRWSARRRIHVSEGGGGCTGAAEPERRDRDDGHAPEIRIAELVERGRIRPGEILHAQLKVRHPSRTGLAQAGGSYVQVSEPFYLEAMEVWFCGERVSRFELTPAVADDPLVAFALRASREGALEVRLVNSRGRRFSAAREIRFS
jgi:desulfoferrodoxin (superoxide reductase-like protein)